MQRTAVAKNVGLLGGFGTPEPRVTRRQRASDAGQAKRKYLIRRN
jgi:hypothetical protein